MRWWSRPTDGRVACRDVMRELTAYLEGACGSEEAGRLDAHFARCRGCAAALAQLRVTLDLVGELREDDLEPVAPEVREQLVAAFVASTGA